MVNFLSRMVVRKRSNSIFTGVVRKRVLVIGGSGHGSVIASCIKDNIAHNPSYELDFAGYVNDFETIIDGYPVMGRTSDISRLASDGYYFAWGIHLIAKNRETIEAYCRISVPKDKLVTIIHHTAFIAESVVIEPGCFIMCNSYIGPRTYVGEGTMIKANTCIGHDVKIGRLCHVAMGATVGSYSEIGECSDVAIGATVLDKCKIGNCSMAGAGCVLTTDIPNNQIYVGIPAKYLRNI